MDSGRAVLISAVASLVSTLALGGCYARYRGDNVVASGGTVAATHVDVSTGSRLGAAVIVGIVAAGGYRYYRIEPDGSKTPLGTAAPDPDPDRRVDVQDCTRPRGPSTGNLMCR